MLTSRSIPTELWVHARNCLVFYFSRRHGIANPEDLAQETLIAVWSRDDYEIEKEEDFLKVCYGFARNILHEGYRESKNHVSCELDPMMESSAPGMKGLEGTELAVFLSEVCSRAEAELLREEWALIEAAVGRDADEGPASGKIRVKLHRARKKLAKITGWHNK